MFPFCNSSPEDMKQQFSNSACVGESGGSHTNIAITISMKSVDVAMVLEVWFGWDVTTNVWQRLSH